MPYYWAKHTSRTPEERALNFSYAFLGVRLECAQCHKHPFDRWTQDDFKGFTALFDRVGFGVAEDDRKTYQEMLTSSATRAIRPSGCAPGCCGHRKARWFPGRRSSSPQAGTRVEKGKVVKAPERIAPRVLGGDEVGSSAKSTTRARPLMDWMRRKDNPVLRPRLRQPGLGRVLRRRDHQPARRHEPGQPAEQRGPAGLPGRGVRRPRLRHEVAAPRDRQQPGVSAVLAVERDEPARRAELQPGRRPPPAGGGAVRRDRAGDRRLRPSWPARRPTSRSGPSGPKGGALVGRYGYGNYASTVFGRSPRDTNCDCSASNEPNLLQAIYLQNDKEVLAAIDRKDGWLHEISARLAKASAASETDALINEAFLRTLSRPPTAAEVERSAAHLGRGRRPAEGFHDLLWAC